jgi:hypothetical protein
MGVQMPVLDGVQATAQIRALPSPKNEIPIIALTAHAMAGAREEYLAAGMDDYLSKPLEPEALFAALARLSPACHVPAPAVEPAQSPRVAIFDPVRVATLKRLLSEGELAEFVGMFVGSLEGITGRVTELLDAGEFNELTQEAHALAGRVATGPARRWRKSATPPARVRKWSCSAALA